MSENDEPFDLDDDEPLDKEGILDLDEEGILDLAEPADLEETVDLDEDLDLDQADLDERGATTPGAEGEPVPAPMRASSPNAPGPRNWSAKDLSDDKARVLAIEEVLRDQARREVLREIAYRQPRASFRMRVAAGVLGVVAMIFWFLPLPFLQPNIPFPVLPEDELAGLRFATYVQSQQVEAFRHSSGRLPDQLREAGEPIPGMSYERLNASTYRLSARTERVQLQVKSDSLDAVIADSLRLPGVAR